ncbi:hypothetical protein A2U01_0093948 [Trifolium medium]|uniref:Uncharacterized protein n=1 Tax=Trifolium medium TaxID=97028 RepID=A0A392ULR9_9FABA|nr:hypothetical protein [Trifolium medium]
MRVAQVTEETYRTCQHYCAPRRITLRVAPVTGTTRIHTAQGCATCNTKLRNAQKPAELMQNAISHE